MLSPSLRPDKTQALSPEQPSSQIQFPFLANKVMPEAMVRLLLHQHEACTLVNAMRRSNVSRSQRRLLHAVRQEAGRSATQSRRVCRIASGHTVIGS